MSKIIALIALALVTLVALVMTGVNSIYSCHKYTEWHDERWFGL